MADSTEVIIVGAGVAGLALAMRLGEQGRAVLLLDRSAAPRDKVCGEGLMPLGMAALAGAGLDPRALPGQDFRGLVYRSSRQETLLDFGQGVWGSTSSLLMGLLFSSYRFLLPCAASLTFTK